MGITTQLFPDEVTKLCNTASEPNDKPGPDGLADVDRFARFLRASKAPARDLKLADTPAAKERVRFVRQSRLRSLPRANAWLLRLPARRSMAAHSRSHLRLGNKTFHPFGDFLLHDVGTGDGIVIPTVEHYGRASRQMPKECSPENFQKTRNRVRTAPLWGVRLRTRLMHDGATVTLRDAILRHGGEADQATRGFSEAGSEGPGGDIGVPEIALTLEPPAALIR